MNSFKPKMSDQNQKANKPLVSKYMVGVAQLITFKPDTPILKALDTMLEKHITGAPVLNDKGEVVGLIDDKDCLNILVGGGYYNHPIGKETVSSYMSNVMKTISINIDIFMAATILLTTPYKRLIVLDENGKLAGQISRRDILRAIKDLNMNTW
ncbi:MAG: inosine-5-monophosphate dehydrogenase [Bacteroidetes bacterium]|nr:MAG: inosine-5-monophosphate dehydrogenase [Bacteroidota bacterium]